MSMEQWREFEITETPLANLNLIEASAGTGKTWTITGLYVRLILERGFTVGEILVVTYTKAATAELRERIRRRLTEVLAAFESGQSGDVFCQKIIGLHQDAVSQSLARQRLRFAIRNFDEAAIFTIHGFCQRVLSESAFESDMPFESELTADDTELVGEIVDDFWRRETASASGLWLRFLADQGETPDLWRRSIAPHLGKPFLLIAPLPPVPETAPLEIAVTIAYQSARELWLRGGEEIGRFLLSSGLNQTSYKADKLPQWFAELDRYFASPEVELNPATPLPKLTPQALAKGTRKGSTTPSHPFFDACQNLLDAIGRLHEHFIAKRLEIRRRLIEHCNTELPERKLKRGLVSYDDLLNRLAEALGADADSHLARTVRQRYRAALIDEFQDTDPVQYEIFRSIYGQDELPVFFVGDPKQAIYGFRGADVFSYLEVRDAAQAHHTLVTNQRSIPTLIAAVNALFSWSPHPFLLDTINYLPTKPAEKARPQLIVQGDDTQPLRFALLPARQNTKGEEAPMSKAEANQLAAEFTATSIAHLLTLASRDQASLTDGNSRRTLTGGDIAVLVPSHRQGRLMQEALTARGVPSVRQGQDNVFASVEAVELERILLAIVEPRRETRITSALATSLIGMDGTHLFLMKNDEAAWEKLLDDFSRYRELWQERGFMPMFRCWMEEDRVAERLLSYRNGERRLTNLLHLAELLQTASREKSGVDSLIGWFQRALRTANGGDEEALLRLESDDERVKIVTIHASKGLEYPIVFCPFLWDGKLWHQNETDVGFHDPSQNNRPTLSLGGMTIEAHRDLAGTEKLAEKLRLLYVALTRAVQRCYLVWGYVKGMETSAPAWLLHGPSQPEHAPLAAMDAIIKKMGHAELEETVRKLAARCHDGIAVEPLVIDQTLYRPPPPKPESLRVLHFRRGALSPSWRMSSFSALTGGRHSETPDYDAPPSEMPPETAIDESIFAFPRGANAGRCLHAIFEAWDFTSRDTESLLRLIRRKLKGHAIAETWAPTVADMVAATLNIRLDGKQLRLRELDERHRLAELEFTYPLRSLELTELKRILTDPTLDLATPFAEASRTLDFEMVSGFMKGFIDLTFEADGRFYVADYKSNWLGNRPEDYGSPRLMEAMARDHYYLQYLIYSLALHRYLRLRLPDYDYERHFGGVFYLFLRGIDPQDQSDTGVFRDRPSRALIDRLDRLFS